MNDSAKQLFVYLQPLLSGVNRSLVKKLNFDNFNLSDDMVLCCKKNCANEVFIKILFTLRTFNSYKTISFSRICAINSAYKTGYRDPEYGALGAITDTKVLFITSGGFEAPPHAGNILDVIISARRSLGLKTYVFHLGSKEDFLSFKSNLLTNVNSLNITSKGV